MLPFTREQFVVVFGDYNAGIWPVQILAYVLGITVVALLLRRSRAGDRLIGGALAAMWLWTGLVYHWLYFTSINSAPWLFGALFVLQGLVFLYAVVLRGTLRFGSSAGATSWVGWAFVVYAAVVYPLLGLWAGHHYREMPMFGVTPCPVTIFTFGLLLLTTTAVPRWMLAVPLVWSLIGGSAAFLLGIPQDWLLLFSGVATWTLLVLRDRGRQRLVAA